ncbi:MAG: DUF2961 domain-containing protein [Oscillospiraceae bacterium]|nr:DUF2961 domain-containing protein [Oscillospiraceae bacterium]
MEIFQYDKKEPVWISFENRTGARAAGGKENFGAKGHPFEPFSDGEEKILCDVDGPVVIRRIWLTISERTKEVLANTYFCAYWDDEASPSICVPISEFFCMGRDQMVAFENEYFSSPEGRSFVCTIPMPARKHAKLTLKNLSGQNLSHLFYDVDLTKEELGADVLYFHASHTLTAPNELGESALILPEIKGKGRFLGMNVSIQINPDYMDSWWGEGEVKIYLDGEKEPSLVGTGTEDYLGTAWELGTYSNRWQGCTVLNNEASSFYRFHGKDPIFFENGCRVELQTIGGTPKPKALLLARAGVKMIPVAYDTKGTLHPIYRQDWTWEEIPEEAFVTFYRQDHFSAVAYYYLAR